MSDFRYQISLKLMQIIHTSILHKRSLIWFHTLKLFIVLNIPIWLTPASEETLADMVTWITWIDYELIILLNNISWWRHQIETFSALLTLCAGNSRVIGEFPSQRPVTRSFDVFSAWTNRPWARGSPPPTPTSLQNYVFLNPQSVHNKKWDVNSKNIGTHYWFTAFF